MASPQVQGGQTASNGSVDLWKFFEDRGSSLKESMFKVVTWIVGLAGAILAFAIKEGFGKGLAKVTEPGLVLSLGLIGLVVIVHAVVVIRDYGHHINRTFARADAARVGETVPQKIWEAGHGARRDALPPVCRHLLFVTALLGIGFALLVMRGLCALMPH